MFETLDVRSDGGVVQIALNRPSCRNALNDRMMDELITAIGEADQARVIVLTGNGTAFCAGADLNWMAAMKDAGYDENREDAARLARLFRTLRTARPVTMAVVNGPAIGGAVGLVSACDIAISLASAVFSFGEVRLGIVPAVIGPYIVEKTGISHARYYMLTGERFDGVRAQAIGLVHRTAEQDAALQALSNEIIGELMSGGAVAQRQIKELADRISPPPATDIEAFTVDLIARARVSEEGQEGIRAFLEKRKPSWLERTDETI